MQDAVRVAPIAAATMHAYNVTHIWSSLMESAKVVISYSASCPAGLSPQMNQNKTFTCTATLQNSCPSDCLSCISSLCTVCPSGYTLFITPLLVSCRRNTVLSSCLSSFYNSYFNGTLCYTNATIALQSLTQCQTTVPKCSICSPSSSSICVACV